MSDTLRQLWEGVAPVLGMILFVILFIAGLFVFSYLLIIGAIVGLILFIIAFIRLKIAQRRQAKEPLKEGRIIEHDKKEN